MTTESSDSVARLTLRAAVVLRATPDGCEVFTRQRRTRVRYSAPFAPRADRVQPGHLVAVAVAADGSEVIVWRWFDAVILGEENGQVRLWEPAHDEVLAQSRFPGLRQPGSRGYLSAGLDGADWWLAGDVVGAPESARVELTEVREFYVQHGLWDGLL